MTTTLKEMQFELLPYADAEEGVAFGIGLPVAVDGDGFQPGGYTWETQDSANPINGAYAFGRDHLLGPSWAWNGHVDREDTETAVESLAELATAWRGGAVTDSPGQLCAMRYRLAGRDRRVFGRPRRFEANPNNLIMAGFTAVATDFQCVDANTYDDIESTSKISMVSGSDGGFIFPVVFPISSLPVGENSNQIVVGGDVSTFPVVRFDGPLTNPILQTDHWTLSLTMSIAAGEYVEIDTRPWAQTIMLNGTSSAAGALGRRQWLSNMALEPGRHDLTFRGSGNGACEVRWRSAWSSI